MRTMSIAGERENQKRCPRMLARITAKPTEQVAKANSRALRLSFMKTAEALARVATSITQKSMLA